MYLLTTTITLNLSLLNIKDEILRYISLPTKAMVINQVKRNIFKIFWMVKRLFTSVYLSMYRYDLLMSVVVHVLES